MDSGPAWPIDPMVAALRHAHIQQADRRTSSRPEQGSCSLRHRHESWAATERRRYHQERSVELETLFFIPDAVGQPRAAAGHEAATCFGRAVDHVRRDGPEEVAFV